MVDATIDAAGSNHLEKVCRQLLLVFQCNVRPTIYVSRLQKQDILLDPWLIDRSLNTDVSPQKHASWWRIR